MINVACINTGKNVFNNIVRCFSEYSNYYDFKVFSELKIENILDNIDCFDIVLSEPKTLYSVAEKIENISDKKVKVVISSTTSEPNVLWVKTLLYNVLKFKQFELPLKNGVARVNIDDIYYFENKNRHIFVKTATDYFQVDLTLREVEILVEEYNFYSPYVSFFINLEKVEKVLLKDIQLNNKDIIPISQKKSRDFKQFYKSYLSFLQKN